MADPEVVVRLLAAIDETAANAAKIHDERCGLVLGTISGNLNDECDCGIPADLLRLCQSHRDIVAEYVRVAERREAIAQQVRAGEPVPAEEVEQVPDMDQFISGISFAVAALARGYGIEDGETK